MISFTVRGEAKPKGSTRAFVVAGKAITTSANKNTKEWQHLVAAAAQEHAPEKLYDEAVAVSMNFYLRRPASVSEKKRPYPTVKPDSDKLIRTVLDSLKGIIYSDDAKVVMIFATKEYGDPPRVEITVRRIEE